MVCNSDEIVDITIIIFQGILSQIKIAEEKQNITKDKNSLSWKSRSGQGTFFVKF